jgi:hypothetical protein
MKRLNHRPDITVLENRVPKLASSPDDNIDHYSGQVVGPNHLVREERLKHGVDRAHTRRPKIHVKNFVRCAARLHLTGVGTVDVCAVGAAFCDA